jgi:hypothetical protein
MSTLGEIEAATDRLSQEEKQELLVYLLQHFRRTDAELPAVREFSQEQTDSWIREDEAEMERFRRGQ